MKIGNSLYFDHQATTPLDPRVLAKMRPFLEDTVGNPHSSDHAFGWQAAQAVENAASQISRLIGADTDEIIFTSGATEANNLALLGLARTENIANRKRILLSSIEHKSILSIAHLLKERLGFNIDYLPVDTSGRISLQSLKDMIDTDVFAVSIIAVNNEIGIKQNIKELSKITKNAGAIFHCDAAQAPCAIDLTTFADWVDLLSLSAHKMYGPQGIGALFAKRELHERIEPIIYGGGQQNGLRSGTVPVALCIGMGEACTLIHQDESIFERQELERRRNLFVKELTSLPWSILLNGPELGAERHPGNANICFRGFSAHDILTMLQPNLAASTGSACTTGVPEPSHVLRAIGLSHEDAESSIRFSIGHYTTDKDITDAVNRIKGVLAKLTKENILEVG